MKVVASKIDRIHFFYLCPFCQKSHKHGSSNQFHNRIEHRASHCTDNREDVEIYINDYTKRIFDKVKKKSPTKLNAKETTKRNCGS